MYLYKFCVMLSRRLPQKYKEKKQKKADAHDIDSEKIGGAEGDRTLDLMIANHSLSQLSYSPSMPLTLINLNFKIKRQLCSVT